MVHGFIQGWLEHRISKLSILRHFQFAAISMADTSKNYSQFGKSFKIGTNEAYNITIKISVLKIFCSCSYINMAALLGIGISLQRKILEKVFT